MPRTVLIVEDERDINQMMAELVSARGFKPLQLYEGRDVIETVRRVRPVVVLLDLMLPDMHGYQLCEELKKTRETNLIPVLMVTALSDSNHHAAGVRVGANAYIPKPFRADQLIEAIDQALAWRREHETHGVTGEIVFNVRGEIAALQQVNDMLTDLLNRTPLTERQVKDLRQAVMEMGGNAIEWGHKKNADLPLSITYRIDPEAVTLLIKDQGPGFNPSQVPHAAKEEDPVGHLDVRSTMGIREGGFGIMLARGLVDGFSYNSQGNEVTMIKRFQRSKATPD